MSKTAAFRLLAAFLAGTWLLSLIGCWNYSLPGSQGDDAAYWHMALDLVQLGQLKVIDSYLPGWPILASPVVGAGFGILGMRVLSATLAAACALFLYLTLSKRLSKPLALTVAMLYLMNSVSMRLATTMMSDHSFSFLIFLVVYLVDLNRSNPKDPAVAPLMSPRVATAVAFIAGFIVGFAGLVRVVGVPVAAALWVALLCQRRLRESIAFALGSALSLSLAFPILYAYFYRAATLGGNVVSERQLPVWNVIASEFLTITDLSLGTWVFVALSVLFVIGCCKSIADEGIGPLVVVIPAHLILQLPYPFQVGRYFVWDWPLFVYFVALGVTALVGWKGSSRAIYTAWGVLLVATLGLSGLGLIELEQFAERQQGPIKEQLEMYAWIREHLPEPTKISTNAPERLWLNTSRKSVGLPLGGDTYQVMLQAFASNQADYVVEEMFYSKKSYTPYVPRMDLWLERSSLFKKLFETPQEKLFQWQGDRGRVTRACRHYISAHQFLSKQKLIQARESCGRALEELEDFPEARHLYAALGLQLSADGGRKPDPKDIALLEKELQQYPHDLATATTLASAYTQIDVRRAVVIVDQSLLEAQKDGLPEKLIGPLLQLRQQLHPK